MDIPAAPGHFFTEEGELVGYDVDLASEIAARFGLEWEHVNSVWDTIIQAVTVGKCDVIISGMSVRPERKEKLRLLPYVNTADAYLVQDGNPTGIVDLNEDPLALCGRKAAAEQGSHPLEVLKEMNEECVAAGQPEMELLTPLNNNVALQQLTTGHAEVWNTGVDLAGFIQTQQPDLVDILSVVGTGAHYAIAIPYDRPSLIDGMIEVVRSIEEDGTYLEIMTKWGQEGAGMPPDPATDVDR
jgi:polar amino acid transport system substrate-binding protein